jgi:signal transduction histidine kinase
MTFAGVNLIAVQSPVDCGRHRAVLEERRRLSRDLHDSVSQALHSIDLAARTVRALLDEDPARAHEPVEHILRAVHDGLAEMRALIGDVRHDPVVEHGLVSALESHLGAVAARHRLTAEAALGAEPAVALEVKHALFSAAREALQNVATHAKANRVAVRLEQGPATVVLEISDDGRGFDPNASFPGHLGLASMRERVAAVGGQLDISSERGQGTRVLARVPCRWGDGG